MTNFEPFYKKPANTFVFLLGTLNKVWRMLTGGGQSLSRISKYIKDAENSLRTVLTSMAEKHCAAGPAKTVTAKTNSSRPSKPPAKKSAAPAQKQTDAFGLAPLRPFHPRKGMSGKLRAPNSKPRANPRPKPSDTQQREHLLARLCRLEDALKNPGAYVEAFAKSLKRQSRPLKIEDLFEHTAADHAAVVERVMQQNLTGEPYIPDSS